MELNGISVDSPPCVNLSQELNMSNFKILEDGPQVSQDTNLKTVSALEEGPQVSQDLNVSNLQILEDGPLLCPLCSHEMRLYYINYSEKIEMCENLECDYPFGHEPLKIVREENGIETVELKSIPSKGARSIQCSQASSQVWSDVNKLCNVFETDEVSNMNYNRQKNIPQSRKTESDRRKEELLENVEKIKQMTKSMNESKKEKRIIKNEKWIKNLQYLQGLSGISLLKPEEMKKIKKKNGTSSSAELKIDIDENDLGSIKIEVNRARASDGKIV